MYEKIDKLLKEQNITPYRMCKDLALPTSSATAWKQGQYNPSITTLKKIADYFGVTVDYFL
jgi:transcriptional regulator with XRE-family HTH domain